MADRAKKIENGVEYTEMQCREGHSWWRKSQRGKPPHWCPEHKPVEAPKPAKKVLEARSTLASISQMRDKSLAAVGDTPTLRPGKSEQSTRKVEIEAKDRPKTAAEMAEQRAQEQRKAASDARKLTVTLAETQAEADAACAANISAMDALGSKPEPALLRKQENTYKVALSACHRVRALEAQLSRLEAIAA